METEDLLGQVARHVREEGAAAAEEDPVWERLARGELSAEEDAALRARAAADPETQAMYEAFRPLSAEVRERLVQQATSDLARPSPVRVRPWRRLAVAVAVPLAVAAALLLVLHRPPVPGGTSPLPSYALAFTGGDRTTRSGEAHDDAAVVLHGSSRVEIVLRPSTAVPGEVSVQAFLVQGDRARPWPVPMQRSADGAIRIAGEAGPLLGVPAGDWDMVFVVGRTAAVVPDEVVQAARGTGGPRPWQLLERHVRLLDGN